LELGAAESVVRIAVLAGPDDSYTRGEATRALRRLGGEVEVDWVRDAESCSALAERHPLDLIVLEQPGLPAARAVLAEFREDGLPIIALTDPDDEAGALAAFRLGVADCVSLGPDLGEVLSLVALEQIRRYRQQRERAWLARRIGELQRYNENIIQNLNSALLVVDPAGVVTYANPTAEAVLRCGDDQLEGQGIWNWFPGVSREETLIGRTLATGERHRGAETLLTRRDGSVVPIGISCAPLLGDVGEQHGAVAIFQDLSEISQLRAQVLQNEKMASIGELAAGVAHEINNPMGFIHANLYQMTEYISDLQQVWAKVEALQKAVGAGEAEALRAAAEDLHATSSEVDVHFVLGDLDKAVRESQEGSERIRHIVQDLRDFARQDDGERMPSDLNQCVDSTASIVWTMMRHSVVLEKDYADLPSVRCNPMQLKQVVMNLLVNAYHAIEAKIGDSGELGQIVVRTREASGGVEVSIEDSGIGIAPADRDRIFDPFFTTKKVGAGTGLGLSTSHSIVRKHGGQLRFETELGVGSTFTVWLPLECPEGAEGETA
jgi:PAS domain S-box-containing protein